MLENKVAIVTGASRGIGREIAIQLAESGANVVINYAGNQQKAEEVKKEIENRGQQALVLQGDVSDVEDVKRLFEETVKAFGKVDILVNNAGITKDALLLRMKEKDWDDVVNVNLKGVFLCSQQAAKVMIKQRSGRIVNVSSVVGLMGNPGQVNYVATKSGVLGMTKTMAKELASRNITVNAVAPGFIATDMTDELTEELKAQLQKQIPLGTLGQAKDVACAVRYLVSEDAQYITGQTLSIDGGMHM